MSLNSADAARLRPVGGKRSLSTKDKFKRLEPYLPPVPTELSKRNVARRRSMFGVRRFLTNQLHLFVYVAIHFFFSFYIRTRQAYHFLRDQTISILKYHHRTPELIQSDVDGLDRKPKHLSVILRMEDASRSGAELERLVNEVADIAAWCACAGVPTLSVYEKTGILKGYLAQTHRAVCAKLESYYGRVHPAVSLSRPHSESIESTPRADETQESGPGSQHLHVLLISEEDGRDSIVDLTRTLTEMAQRGKMSLADVSIELIDTELTEAVMGEPDLLILFGPDVELQGYPPWQIRLTEIFHVQDNNGVAYHVFLRGLQNYASAKMRFGK